MNLFPKSRAALFSIVLTAICSAAFSGFSEELAPLPGKSAEMNWLAAQTEFQKAGALLGAKKFQEAENMLETAATQLPAPYAAMAKGFAQRAANLPKEPDSRTRLEAASELCAELQAYPAARKLKPSRKKDDDDGSAISTWLLLESGNRKEALAEYKRKLEGEYVEIYQDYHKKQIEMLQGRATNLASVTAGLEMVREHYLSGLEEKADFFGALRELNRILPLVKESKEGVLVYQNIIKCLAGLNDEAAADTWENKLLADFPSHSEASAEIFYDRGVRAFRQRHDPETSLKLMRQLCKKWPDSNLWGDAQYAVGVIFQDQKKYDEAIAEYSVIFPSKVNDRLLEEGSTENGKNYRFRTALRISECYEAKNDLVRALEYAKMANERYPFFSFCSFCMNEARKGADNRAALLTEKIKAAK